MSDWQPIDTLGQGSGNVLLWVPTASGLHRAALGFYNTNHGWVIDGHCRLPGQPTPTFWRAIEPPSAVPAVVTQSADHHEPTTRVANSFSCSTCVDLQQRIASLREEAAGYLKRIEVAWEIFEPCEDPVECEVQEHAGCLKMRIRSLLAALSSPQGNPEK